MKKLLPIPVFKNHERFLSKLKVNNTTDCWEWTGAKNKKGYGRISFTVRPNQTVCYAHRVSYEIFHGTIEAGKVIDHKCRNRACCNPDHIHAVTARENLLENSMNFMATKCKKTLEYFL